MPMDRAFTTQTRKEISSIAWNELSKAKEILPYTMAALLVSGVIFMVGLALIV